MTTSLRKLVVCVMLGVVPALPRPAVAQADERIAQVAPPPPAPTEPPLAEPTPKATPPSPAPAEPPPPPPSNAPTPPAQAQAPAAPAPAGQWVYTQQYGWVWMPYGDAFTYIPPNGYGEPLEYVFYPSFGWRWVVAPWVWGIGPWPYWGLYGPRHFAWYGHGWWRTPSRWHFRPAPTIHERPGSRGIRPPPVRGGRGHPGGRGEGHR